MSIVTERFAGSRYVNGTWSAAGGDLIDVIDPADEQVIARLHSGTEADVDAALSAAHAAQRDWARTPSVERGAHIRAIADLLAEHREPLAKLLSREVGKPLAEAFNEVGFAEAYLRYNAEWDRRLEGEILPGDVRGETIHLLRVPVGVVAAICPWNFPLAVLCRKIGPALITGNTVVIKPSEISPLSTIELARLIDEQLDLPKGVINVVAGARVTGQALVDSPLTSLISFTGHRDTGKQVMERASRHLTRVSLELGGKAPAIVWRDADLDVAIPAIVTARHANAGQVCTSAERVFVHREIADAFTERYVAAVSALSVGAPDSTPGVDMGPLASKAQLAKTAAAVATARSEGAEVLLGGDAPDAARGAGYWFAPTVLGGVKRDMRIMVDETFGPVTPIMAIDSLDEALEISNDSRYGLSAYLFSRDYPTVMRTVDELDFGEIYINRTLGESVHAHHTGYKESGMGGEDGKWGMLRYTQIKTAYHHHG
ncbi:MAG TPA: aldehyde dehydrogenase [Conexibacter sp.]|jgi:lactaldehyde dehydrogenase/glycolaldehyde dehydrogenase